MKGVLLSCQVTGINSLKDGSVKISIESQELSGGKAGEIFDLRNKVASVYISPATIDPKEIETVDKIEPDFNTKSQSQRIRAVLFKLFEQDNEGFKDFRTFYESKTERIIEHYKSKLNP